MTRPKDYFLNVKFLRRLLIIFDDLMHFAVALILLICAGLILVRSVPTLFGAGLGSVLEVLNNVLLVLIVMELLWPIVRFLKREPFTLNPFLYIGIISSVRRILLIEAEHSVLDKVGGHGPDWESTWPVLVEVGANVLVILVLAVSLRILASRPGGEDL